MKRSKLMVPLAALLISCSALQPFSTPQREPVTRSSHQQYFPIDANSAHKAQTCSDCHADYASFTQFSCVTCHDHQRSVVSPLHQQVASFEFSSTSCYSCHPQGTLAQIDHEQLFPLAKGQVHAGIACKSCHITPASYASFDCTKCHSHPCESLPAIHTEVLVNFTCDSPKCLLCHPKSGTITRASHAAFPINRGDHRRVACPDCHTGTSVEAFSCTSCHEHACARSDRIHSRNSRYSCNDQRCYDCHAKGEEEDD